MKTKVATTAAVATLLCLIAGCGANGTQTPLAGNPTSTEPNSSYPCGLAGESEVASAAGEAAAHLMTRGAICQWTLDGHDGGADAVFSWFVDGSLQREQSADTALGYTVAPTKVARARAFTARDPANPAACSVTAETDSGVVSWWLGYRGDGAHPDPCTGAATLTALTLNKEP
ncbi:DUF3558 domain-containing protein [Prescottella agglutinans]|uniref:DUF3558 domain-containing protein n=1 Tax=Prescottella agglutinans TaxID=1644129 RepID=A0ABT6MH09_9NOCA|nr:DUF3558 domain-containing protein [Prescottella agglutinans]MDH6283567.1 hypothetical protein [Prescottella agglutinans]